MGQKRLNYLINLGYAALAGLSGCVPIVTILIGIIIGLFLDNFFNADYIFSILCIVISVPLSLVLMLFTAYRSAKTIQKRQYGTD